MSYHFIKELKRFIISVSGLKGGDEGLWGKEKTQNSLERLSGTRS